MSFLKRVQSSTHSLSFPHVATLTETLRGELARAAQGVYDDWTLDADGYHWQVGAGGICHLIADALLDVLYAKIPRFDGATVSSDHEQHVYVVGRFAEGIYLIDIHHSVYERGGGFTWKKIEDVHFTPHDVTVERLSRDLEDYKNWVEQD